VKNVHLVNGYKNSHLKMKWQPARTLCCKSGAFLVHFLFALVSLYGVGKVENADISTPERCHELQ
jgi:type II secretory pathway component PulL